MSSVLRVLTPFACDVDGVPHVYRAGDLVERKAKVVKGREQFFSDAEEFAQRASIGTPLSTETASAAPGELRYPNRRARRKAEAEAAAAEQAKAAADAQKPSGTPAAKKAAPAKKATAKKPAPAKKPTVKKSAPAKVAAKTPPAKTDDAPPVVAPSGEGDASSTAGVVAAAETGTPEGSGSTES